ncbi:DRAP deaminase [Thoreauomyces humboldtii]|nr:DRAP deaminase [Thoreauomyces humboldtii]
MTSGEGKPLVTYQITDLDGPAGDKEFSITWVEDGFVSAKVRTGDSKFHGKGLFCAQELIPNETMIDHYHGQCISSGKAHSRHAESDDSFYLLTSNVIVPHPYIPSRYINDSVILPTTLDGVLTYDKPANAMFVESGNTVLVSSIADIVMGDEILISYGEWYWRAVLHERAGYTDLPPRFTCLNANDPDDNKKKGLWLKKLRWDAFPDDTTLVKVPRHRGDPPWDYYLIKKHTTGIWRSPTQYLLHLENLDSPGKCPCEICMKRTPYVRKRSATSEIPNATPPPARRETRNSRRGVAECFPIPDVLLEPIIPGPVLPAAEATSAVSRVVATIDLTDDDPEDPTTTSSSPLPLAPLPLDPHIQVPQPVPTSSSIVVAIPTPASTPLPPASSVLPDPARDGSYMRLAIAEAHRCIPVPTGYNVGAVLVDASGTTILAKGFSRELPGNTHAEECCLIKLPFLAFARGATMYTTMEPCSERNSGNRPCADRLLEAGIGRVVMGVREPAHFVAQCKGVELLRAAGVKVDHLGGFEEECLEPNRHVMQAGGC